MLRRRRPSRSLLGKLLLLSLPLLSYVPRLRLRQLLLRQQWPRLLLLLLRLPLLLCRLPLLRVRLQLLPLTR